MEKSKTNRATESEFIPSFLINVQTQFDDAEETDNGLHLNSVYIPEEIMLHILSYADPKELLDFSLVCRKWNNLIKSYSLWSAIYKRRYKRKPKILPWYVYYCYMATNYFDTNLLVNGNGQHGFINWQFKADGVDRCIVEDPPVGADPLALDVPEFYNKTSCFATSYGACNKEQQIKFGNSKLFQYILDSYKPHIYLSEWIASRFDCDYIYKLHCRFIVKGKPKNSFTKPYVIHHVEKCPKWKKVEVLVTEYPEGVEGIMFEHGGHDTGHCYGCKMAGGVVKLLFNTVERSADEDGNEKPKIFSEVRFVHNGNQAKRGAWSWD